MRLTPVAGVVRLGECLPKTDSRSSPCARRTLVYPVARAGEFLFAGAPPSPRKPHAAVAGPTLLRAGAFGIPFSPGALILRAHLPRVATVNQRPVALALPGIPHLVAFAIYAGRCAGGGRASKMGGVGRRVFTMQTPHPPPPTRRR